MTTTTTPFCSQGDRCLSGTDSAIIIIFLCLYCSTLPLFLSPPGVCGCCGALRPRYKRLVDNIFPEDPEVCVPSPVHPLKSPPRDLILTHTHTRTHTHTHTHTHAHTHTDAPTFTSTLPKEQGISSEWKLYISVEIRHLIAYGILNLTY